MGLTYGTSNKNGQPLFFKFLYGGTEIAWQQPYKINNFSNSGESVDGKYRISDMDVSFVDINGSYFATQFGKGTTGFGSSLQVVAYLGGTMEYQSSDANNISWKRLGTAGAYVATIHTGKVYGVSYSNRILRIKSKTALALTSDLKWQFPITSSGQKYSDQVVDGNLYQLGSFFFYPGPLQNTFLGSTAFYDFSETRGKWKCNAYVLGTWYNDGAGAGIGGEYPAMGGRGTVDVDSNYIWCGTDAGGTNFYDNYDYVKFEGTYFGAYAGTINTEEEAHEFGYLNLDAADADRVSGSYLINRTRFRSTGSFSGNVLHFLAPIFIDGNPKECMEMIMTGAMVSPFFTSSDLDSTTFSASGTNTAFSYFSKKIDFDEKNVLDSMKDIIQSTQALFSVNTSNKFEFVTYGPRNLTQTIPSLGTSDLIDTSFDNLEEDYFNRIIVKYGYDAIEDQFTRRYEARSSGWSRQTDRPKTLECKWISNPNEAEVLGQRIAMRFVNTLPHVGFRTNLNQIGRQIGTLVTITDPNSQLLNKVIQVVGFTKDFQNKTIEFDALDAEALYWRKGFAFWGTTGTLPGDAVSNASVSGWGTLGTVNNINETLYGSQFSWW